MKIYILIILISCFIFIGCPEKIITPQPGTITARADIVSQKDKRIIVYAFEDSWSTDGIDDAIGATSQIYVDSDTFLLDILLREVNWDGHLKSNAKIFDPDKYLIQFELHTFYGGKLYFENFYRIHIKVDGNVTAYAKPIEEW